MSEGAECVMISKRFFLLNASITTLVQLKALVSQYIINLSLFNFVRNNEKRTKKLRRNLRRQLRRKYVEDNYEESTKKLRRKYEELTKNLRRKYEKNTIKFKYEEKYEKEYEEN